MLRYTDVYPTEPQPKKEKLPSTQGFDSQTLGEFIGVMLVVAAFTLPVWLGGLLSLGRDTSYDPVSQTGCFTRGEKVICLYDTYTDERPTREDETGYPESYPEFLR